VLVATSKPANHVVNLMINSNSLLILHQNSRLFQ
jgi:hypothetical protein